MTNVFIFIFSQVAQLHKGGVKVAVRKCSEAALMLITAPLVLIVVLLRPLVLLRFGVIDGTRIGNLTFIPEAYLCWREQVGLPRRTIDIVGYPQTTCNRQLQIMWERTGWFWVNTNFCHVLARACKFWTGSNLHLVNMSYRHWRRCTIHHPHINFDTTEHMRGITLLAELGVPSGAPWVCISNRDSGYLDRVLPPESNAPNKTWRYHNFRNFEIGTLNNAAEAMTQRGYYVLRMGTHVTEPLITGNSMIIDYANHRVQSDFADVYLPANCRFSISADSGIMGVPSIFGKSFAIINHPSLLTQYVYYPWNSTPFLIKRFLNVRTNSFLPVREILQAGLGMIGATCELEQAGVVLIDNTAAEISDLSIEVDSRLCGTWDCDPQDELLQQRLLKIIRLYSPQIIHGNLHARLGASFLRAHQYLLD